MIVGSYTRQKFEVVPDPPPERVSCSLFGVKGLEEVGKFSNHEISIGKITQCKASIAYELVEIVQFRLDLVKNGVLGLLPVLIKQQPFHFFEDIVQDSENTVDTSFILYIFPKKL